ncbi:MAG: ABC transporter substrate-binding protein [bacterium]
MDGKFREMVTRREFMKTTTVIAGGLTVGAPGLLRNVLAQDDGEVIKAVGLVPLTRAITWFGEAVAQGTDDYFKMINEAGGIKGKKLELEVADSQYLVDVGIAQFRRIMAKKPKPKFVFSGETGLTKAITRVIEQEYPGEVIYLGLSQSEELWAPKKHPFNFVMGPTYPDEGRACFRWIKELGAKNVVVVRSDGAWGRDPMDAIREIAPKLGINILEEVIAKVGAVDVTSQVLRIRRLKPDCVFMHGYLHETPARIVKTMKEYGMSTKETPVVMTSWSTNRKFIDSAQEAGQDVYGINHVHFWWEQDRPGIKQIVDFNKKHHPKVDYRIVDYIRAWLCALVAVEGLKRADKLTGEGIKSAIESITDYSTGGLSPDLNLKNHKLTEYTTLYQVKDGELKTIKDIYGGTTSE